MKTDTLTFSDIMRLLLTAFFYRKWIIIATTGITLLMVVLLVTLLPPVFTGAFSIVIKANEVDDSSIMPGSNVHMQAGYVTDNMVGTEERLLTSTSVANRVVEELEKQYGDSFTISWFDKAFPFIKSIGDAIGNQFGEPLSEEQKRVIFIKEKIGELRDSMTVTPEKGTNVILVQFSHFNSQFLEKVLNHYLAAYLSLREEIWESGGESKFFKGMSDSYWKDWEAINGEINKIKKELNFSDPKKQLESLTDVMKDMEATLYKTKTREEMITQYLRNKDKININNIDTAQINLSTIQPILDEMNIRIGKLIVEQNEYKSSRFSEDAKDSGMKQINKELTDIREVQKNTIFTFFQEELKRIKEDRIILTEQFKNLHDKIYEMEKASSSLEVLYEKADILKKQINAVESKFQDTDIRNDLKSGSASNIGVLAAPFIPSKPDFPKKPLLIGASAFLGLVLGLILSIFMEMTDDSIKLPDQVKNVLGLNIIVSLPFKPGLRQSKSKNRNKAPGEPEFTG